MKSQRLDMIEEYVLEHKNASLDTLCEKFNVSKNTIRRDVDILLKRGSIMKVYGGVAALETPQTLPLLSYEERGGRFPEVCDVLHALGQMQAGVKEVGAGVERDAVYKFLLLHLLPLKFE